MNGLSKYDPFHDGNGNPRRLSDPILIAGGGLASKKFFNYIWSKSHSGIFELAEGVELEDELRQMFDYISAIGLKRWAVVADMDLEPELEELLEEKIQAGDGLDRAWLAADLFDANAVINMFGEPEIPYPNPALPLMSDVGDEKPMYSDETSAWLDYWAGQLLDRGAYTTYDHCGYGNDMFWVMGEKEPGSRPAFKLAAHKILSDALVSNCDYVWEGAYENVNMELVDMSAAKHGNWNRYHASAPGDVRQMRFEELDCVPTTGSYIVAVPDSFDTCSGYSRIVDASVLGLVPDDAERFLVFGYPAYAATDRLMEAAREAAEPWFSSPPGEWPKVLYDPNMMFADDENDSAVIPPDAFQPASEFADWKDNEERFEGTVTDSFKARLEALPKYRLGYDLLQEIVPYSIEVNVTLDGAFEEILPLMTFGRLSGAPSPGMPFGGAGLASVEKFVMGTPDLEPFVGVPAEADEIIRRIWQKSSPIRTLDGQEGELAPEELSWHIERAIEDNGLTGKIFEAASLGVPASDIFA